MSFRYQVRTGTLQEDNTSQGGQRAIIGKGYSGHGLGLNNPDFESMHDVGPLPRGNYFFQLIEENGFPVDYEGKKAPVFRILPKPGTNTFGRSGFLLHGHAAGEIIGKPETEQSSLGCMIQEHATRVRVMISTNKDLEVF